MFVQSSHECFFVHQVTGIYRAMSVRVGPTQRTVKSLFKVWVTFSNSFAFRASPFHFSSCLIDICFVLFML